MYKALKTIFKGIIPYRFLIKNELVFRRIYAFFYSGNTHQCPVCNKKLSSFVSVNNKDLLCPNCGSLSRHRRLWETLIKENALKGKVLHFSPSRCLYRKLKKVDGISYFSSDYADEFLADHTYDITNINQPENAFDTIIAYHILEHIPNDKRAISELYRVLKPNGKVFIQTPFKAGDIYENETITSPAERKEHFGQEDHVRIYTIEGLKNRLEDADFQVKMTTFKSQENDVFKGFISPETILIASK
ncbi:methyltransferase domain-containing protein [Gaetbulibacter aestuarii]|uniref:Methyltransferase domain-containing protein n=1 Tax=Gaetbulibacter aestuarii TaxID=1502358 RepID=A0ABW7MYI6_9FLAO